MLAARVAGSSAGGSRMASAAAWKPSMIVVRHSHIGSAPLYVPQTTTLTTLPFPPVANASRRQATAIAKAHSINVQGPLGSILVPLHEFVTLNWDDQAAATKEGTSGGEQEPRKVTVSVRDETEKRQRAMWGLTRALLANAIEGVQDGHTLILRLVGVGYRAAVEEDPFPRPTKLQEALESIDVASAANPTVVKLGNFSSVAQRDFYAAIVKASSDPTTKKQRLALRLGYSHPIFLPIPRGITCTTPQPTRIVLKSVDKEALGAFASSIRKWRPPEPYKGKGVFVGDEQIRLKSVRKK